MIGFFNWVNSLAPRHVREAHPEVRRFIKFAIVGGFGALIDYGTLTILVLGFGVHEYIANIFSVSAAIVSNFTWNTLWTFPESRSQTLHKHFAKFAFVNLIGLGINELVLVLTDKYFFDPLIGHYSFLFAKTVAIGVVLFWNFGINRVWTYRHIEWGQAGPVESDAAWTDSSAL